MAKRKITIVKQGIIYDVRRGGVSMGGSVDKKKAEALVRKLRKKR